jgi:hypothetical protein
MKQLLTVTLLLALAACGGGGGSSSTQSSITDPKISVYLTFNLADSILTGVLQSCGAQYSPNMTQINLMKYDYEPSTQIFTKRNFIIDGTLNLPGITRCSTDGITGTITGVTLLLNENITVYTLRSLAIDASSFQYGTRIFWDNVLKQTGKIINTQITNSQIICTDNSSVPLTAVGDISNFFATCAK